MYLPYCRNIQHTTDEKLYRETKRDREQTRIIAATHHNSFEFIWFCLHNTHIFEFRRYSKKIKMDGRPSVFHKRIHIDVSSIWGTKNPRVILVLFEKKMELIPNSTKS